MLQSINMGSVQRDPSQLARFWGMTWDSTTDTLYTVVSDTFSIFSNTRFFLVRLDRGHDIVAVVIGQLPSIAQGVAMFGIAVDPIGRMFGIDVLGDRLFAIDKNSAQISAIGSIGFSANGALGFDFDDTTGTLYLTSIDDASSTSNLYTVNTLTGQASIVGPLVNGNQHAALAIASGAPCVPPTEVTWLSLSPSSGTILPGQSGDVTVTMDASELPVGTHRANVCVGSNDALSPLVAVPVTLTVTVNPTPTPSPTPLVSISGTVLYCSNPVRGPVPNVTLTLTGSASGSTLSDGSGNYTFFSLAPGGNYTVTPSKAARLPGSAGINTVDVIAVQRHFLNFGTPLSGCRLTAADVNSVGGVNTVDVIAIQRFFLGLSTGIADTGKYQFTPVSRNYPGVVTNQIGQNYETLIFGDVVSGFIHRPGGSSPDLTRDSALDLPAAMAKIMLPQIAVDRAQNNLVAPVTVTAIDEQNKLVAFQGDFTFDERVVTFAGEPVGKAGLTSGNWNVSGNVLLGPGPVRTLRISAYSNDFKPLSGEGPLFELRMSKVEPGTGGTTLQWATSPDQFIFIDADLKTQSPALAGAGSIVPSAERK